MKAQDLLEADVETLSEDATLQEVFALIRRHKNADYPVVDSSMNYRGMLFETELLANLYGEAEKKKSEYFDVNFMERVNADFRKKLVRDIMNSKVRAFGPHELIERVGAVMLFEKAPKVAVVDQGKVIGVVSLSRILSSLMEEFSSKNVGKPDAIADAPAMDYPPEDPRNKRFFKRTQVSVAVAYRSSFEEGKGSSSEGKIAKTINVSAGGLLILTKEILMTGQSLNVALDIYQNNQPIRIVCRIVRCLPSQQQGAYEVGLMFVAIGIDERRRLIAHFDKPSA